MEPGRQSLSSYHGNRINETGDGGTYADSRESDFSTSAVHRLSLEKRTPRRIAVVWPIVRGGPPWTGQAPSGAIVNINEKVKNAIIKTIRLWWNHWAGLFYYDSVGISWHGICFAIDLNLPDEEESSNTTNSSNVSSNSNNSRNTSNTSSNTNTSSSDDEYEENISNDSSSTSNTSSPAATISNVSSSNGDASFVLNIFIIVIGILLILLAIAILIKLKR